VQFFLDSPKAIWDTPRHVTEVPRCFQACRWHSQLLPWLSTDLLSAHMGHQHSQGHLMAIALIQTCLGFDHPGILVQQLPNTPRHPETPRDTQRHPETPRDTQRHPETPRDTQRHPETPRDTQRHPETKVHLADVQLADNEGCSGITAVNSLGELSW